MTTLPFADSPIQPRRAIWVFLGFILINVGIVFFVQNESLRVSLTDLMTPIIGLLSSAALFYTAWMMRSVSSRVALVWLFLALGCLCWVLGDIFWAILEVFLQEEPFPSIADVFYLAYYPFVIVGFLIMPYERPSRRKRITNWLDAAIILLSAGLLYWNFLIGPVAAYEDTDSLTFLMSIAYPVFDLVLFAALIVLAYRKQTSLNSEAKILLGISLLTQIIFDTIYGLQSIAGTYVSGTLLDISWQVGLITFGLAGIYQLRSMAHTSQSSATTEQSILPRLASKWMPFFPYLWLAAAYALLIYSEYVPLPMSYQTIAIVIGVMIALILTRQLISISETIHLSEQLKLELVERQQAQELLRKSHEELEERVRLRTVDLTRVNEQLKDEIEERRHAEERLENSLKEKDVLLKEIHHRVKNNLQVISSMLRLQANHANDQILFDDLLDSQNRIQSMALIHEKLYQSTSLANINFAEYLSSLVSFLQHSYNTTEKYVDIRVETDPLTLGIDSAVPCGLIVNELVSNALKHAFPNMDTGEILLQLKALPDNQVKMVISDNGVGMPESVDIQNSRSLGLQLVNALVNQIDGILVFENSKGSRFTISFSNN